jgi:hypothetical protein
MARSTAPIPAEAPPSRKRTIALVASVLGVVLLASVLVIFLILRGATKDTGKTIKGKSPGGFLEQRDLLK